MDHGWHAFYLLLALAGQRPVAIRAQLGHRRYLAADVEDTAHCTIEFPTVEARVALTWAGERRHTSWAIRAEAGEIRVVDDRIDTHRGGQSEAIVCAESLSDGSHHPAWFGAVIGAFRREIDQPGARGANFAEAEQCLRLLAGAYASAADGGRPQLLRGA